MTLIAVPVFGADIDEVRRRVEAALNQGAELVELRVDLMEGVTDDELWMLRKSFPEAKFILTIRSAEEGGRWDGPDDERVSRLIALGPMADYIDVELALWRRSANIRQKIGLALDRAGHVSQSGGVEEIEFAQRRRLILSRHYPATGPIGITGDLVEMLGTGGCEVAKLAWTARSVRDNFDAFELMRDNPKPSIVICMGEDGLASRVLGKKFDAFCSFASMESGMGTAAGQPAIVELKERYNWDRINRQTRLYGVIGDPVAQSLSPLLHNTAFRDAGYNGVYLPFRVTRSYEAFKAFMVEVLARPWLDAGGFSVTAPHKEHALRFLEEKSASLGEGARQIGAVNTIVLGEEGSIHGFNTDGPAVVEAIRRGWARAGGELSGLTAVVLGAGGMARATVSCLTDAGVRVTVCNRTGERSRELSVAAGCEWRPWDERGDLTADLLVNCTSVGMRPAPEASPIPEEALPGYSCVVETVYRPVQTRLMKDAKARGRAVVTGEEIFLLQAAGQFRRWTGGTLALDRYRPMLTAALAEEGS